jgi:malonyl CoA-acyl carrier protein transacylase
MVLPTARTYPEGFDETAVGGARNMLGASVSRRAETKFVDVSGTAVFVFPGHGSQRRGMGEALFDSVPEFSLIESHMDDLLGYSIRRLCLEDPDDKLRSVRFAHPALYVVNALHYYCAIHAGERPGFLAGHGLGEYNALLAAGVFDLMTGLQLVQKRSELIAVEKPGSMAAVIGLDPLRVAELLRRIGNANLDVAHYNSTSQTTIAGPSAEIRRAAVDFERAGAQMYLPLDVDVAFHSRYLRKAADCFSEFMEPFEFEPPSLPVISNVTAEPYSYKSPRDIKVLLKRHITQPVNWIGTMRYLMGSGATLFKQVGPGDVLARLCRQFHH